jgi:hypothetical protein
MMFINWWVVGETTLALLMITIGVIGFRKARTFRRWVARFGIRLVCVPLAGMGTLFGLLLLLTTASGCESVSAPIFSPSGRTAVRIYDVDGGATGGDTSVEVFWARGFRQANVFSGPWKAVEPADIHWISDSEVRINYRADGPADEYYCKSTAVVKIVCTPK